MTTATEPAVIPWETFRDEQLVWKQGEHVTLIGPTGSGKTTLAHAILPKRRNVCVLGSKPQDRTLDQLVRSGYKRITKWPPPYGAERVIVWPAIRTVADVRQLAQVHSDTIQAVFTEGAWCLYVDDVLPAIKTLRLGPDLELIWEMGRSNGISLVVSAQRPAHIPLLAYSQASHLVMWRTGDSRDLVRLGSIGGYDAKRLAGIVRRLPHYHALWVDTVRRKLFIVNARS